MEKKRRNIKFPLEMEGGVKVRELDEFREYFDLERAIEYFSNGRLQLWLENIYAEDIAENLRELTGDEEDFLEKFTAILGVEYKENEINVERIAYESSLKERLKRFYPEEKAEDIASKAADTQEAFERLVNNGCKEIYLLSGSFCIKHDMKDLQLIGVDEPQITLKARDAEQFRKQNIMVQDIVPGNEETKKILDSDELPYVLDSFLDMLQVYVQKLEKEGK